MYILQKEFIGYEKKVEDAEEKFSHIINEYRLENKRVRRSDVPKYFQTPFLVPQIHKDPKEVFKEVAFHYLDDQLERKKKIEFAELIA